MRTPRMRRDEAGGATVEYSGMTAAAAVLVAALILAGGTVAPGVGEVFRTALCKVMTLGQGSCGTPTSAAAHVPPQPCLVSSDATSLKTKFDVLVFTTSSGRRFEVAKLSDGRYRVTQLASGSLGLETGVGGGVTVTVNDRTVGASAIAEAGVELGINAGQVWYTSDPDEVRRLVSEEGEDTVEDTVIGGGPVRWGWERIQDGVGALTGNGDYEFPEPDEIYVEGGLQADASAELTAGADRAEAGIAMTRMLGRRTTRTGNTTYYFKTTVAAGAGYQTLGEDNTFEGGQANGTPRVG